LPPDLIAVLPPPTGVIPPGFPALTNITPGAALFASLLAGTVPPSPALVPSSAVPSPGAAPLSFTGAGTPKSSVSPLPISTASPETAPAETAAPAPRKLVSGDVPPPLLTLSATLPQAALLPTASTEKYSLPKDIKTKDVKTKDVPLKDSKKENTKEPVDTPSAPVPTGELLLPPPPPLVSAVLPALPAATPPLSAPAPNAPAAPRMPEAVLARAEPAAAPVSWTPPVDVFITTTPSAAVPVAAVPVVNAAATAPGFALPTGAGAGAVQVTPAPDKNSAQKTPQKDLKTTGPRADTYTGTQTELPRLTHLTRTELRTDAAPTDGHPTDGNPTDGTPTEKTRMDERRTDAGHGQAALPAATPLLSTGTAAAAVPELKVPEANALTLTEKREIVQQLADGAGGIRLSAPGTAQEMTVQLHPKDWGSLHVTVQIAPTDQRPGDAPKDDGPKKVTAQIVAETPQVKAALESHTGDLHQKLREAGLHLDSVTVTVRAPEATHSSSGMTPQGGQTDTQGRFQEGAQRGDFGQRMTDFTGRQDGSLGGSTGSFQNSSQGGRQGSQTPREPLHWMGTEPDAEAAPRWSTRQSGTMRLDLRA